MKTGISERAKSSSFVYVFLYRSDLLQVLVLNNLNLFDRWESKFHPSGIHHSISCHVSVRRNALKEDNWKKGQFKFIGILRSILMLKIDKNLSKVMKLLPSLIFDHTLFSEFWFDVNIWSYPPKTFSQTFQFFSPTATLTFKFFPKNWWRSFLPES